MGPKGQDRDHNTPDNRRHNRRLAIHRPTSAIPGRRQVYLTANLHEPGNVDNLGEYELWKSLRSLLNRQPELSPNRRANILHFDNKQPKPERHRIVRQGLRATSDRDYNAGQL